MTAPSSQPNASTPEQTVAAALNEQGFLLAQLVREKIRGALPGEKDVQTVWKILVKEYPVTAFDDSQTRIDLVLSHAPYFLSIECKRPHPKYKRWVFFNK